MTFETFCRELIDAKISIQYNGQLIYFPDKQKPNSWQIPYAAKTAASYYIEHEYVVGGATGGSCWGGTPEPFTADTTEEERQFSELDTILEKYWPTITFLEYKKLYRDSVTTTNRYSNDYYGNYTEYSVQRVNLWDLFQRLPQSVSSDSRDQEKRP